MADKNHLKNPATNALFEAILSLNDMDECYSFFEDLCTMKELADMAQRLEAAKMLLEGKTYEQIVKSVEISTATISRINRCIQYGNGGYAQAHTRVAGKAHLDKTGRPQQAAGPFYWKGKERCRGNSRFVPFAGCAAVHWGRKRSRPSSVISSTMARLDTL